MGEIHLEPSSIFLDEVSVIAEKPTYSNHLDKKVYHVEKDIMSESGSVSEILQNIPSVTVDINGGISLRNTSNVTIFLNGKPSAMLRRNAASVLSQIPASLIERIEIITNPSAKYRPDGIGGIFNIVLKKETKAGLTGQLSANIGTENRYNGNINLNYRLKKVKFFTNYSLRHSGATNLYTDHRSYKSSESGSLNRQYFENGNSNVNALSHNIFAGINYRINDFNTTELSCTYFLQNSFHRGFADIFTLDSTGNPEYSFTNNQTNDEFEAEGEGNLSFKHTFRGKEDHTLTFEATYSSFNEREELEYIQTYSYPENNTTLTNNLVRKSGSQQELIVDYSLPISEDAEFESGYSGEFVFENIRYDRNGSANQFLFNQQIHAFYVLYGQSVESFMFEIGLRAEQTFIFSHLKMPADSLISVKYFKLFPTLHLGFEMSKNKQILLSYSKWVNRPDADELNPNPEFSDPRNAEAENPYLKPEQTLPGAWLSIQRKKPYLFRYNLLSL